MDGVEYENVAHDLEGRHRRDMRSRLEEPLDISEDDSEEVERAKTMDHAPE